VIEAALGVREDDFEQLHLLALCSPSTKRISDAGQTLFGRAAEAVGWDVLRIARERGWYRPARGECPSARQLGRAA
jgi:hypothetical protein